MMTNISLYFSFLFLLAFLTEEHWEKFGQKMINLYDFLKKARLQMGIKTGLSRENWPLFGEEIRGRELLKVFPEMEAKLSLGVKNLTIHLPRYKFYTPLLFNLLEIHRRLGVSLKAILPELRVNLIKDLQFEKKMISNMVGGNIQFMVITFTTWSFILLSSTLADLPLRYSDLFLISLVEGSAFLVFNISFSKIKNHSFTKYDDAIERLYLFVSLAEIGLPINQVLDESKVLESPFMVNKSFRDLAERLTGLVKRWKEMGFSPRVETHEIIKEIWHAKEADFERFLKHLDLLKFVILAFFFLPAYFFYLYSIFKFFMEQ